MEWFIGVVEDILDPEEMGRVRTRIIGVHTENKSEVPTEALPWAAVMTPTTSASISEVGNTPRLLPGTWVVGFFHDGEMKQDPIIMGSLPGKPTEARYSDVGFVDPSNTYPRYIGDSDLPFEARGGKFEDSSTFLTKTIQRVIQVPKASRPELTSILEPSPLPAEEYESQTWDEYEVMNDHFPEYPMNQVRKSEAGIVEEWDDSPGKVRTNRFHPSGTYEEVYNDGSRALHVEGFQNVYIKKGTNVYVEGDVSMTVKGSMRQYVTEDYIMEVGGDYTRKVHGSMHTKVAKDNLAEIQGNRDINIAANDSLTVGMNKTDVVTKNFKLSSLESATFYTTGPYDNTVMGDFNELVTGKYNQTNLGTLTVVSKGNILLETPSSMTENISVDSTISVGGTKIETANVGSITYTDGDVVASSISLTGHKHTGDSGGTTTKPIGA